MILRKLILMSASTRSTSSSPQNPTRSISSLPIQLIQSKRLRDLANQLSLYRPLSTTDQPPDDQEIEMEAGGGGGGGGVISQVGLSLEITAPPPHDPSFAAAAAAAAAAHDSSSSSTGMMSDENLGKKIEKIKKRAAVLICLFEDDKGELRVILTRRASNLSSHSGEVALPGGKAEEGDAGDTDTALREAKEEIGLDPSSVTLVTVLEPFLSKHLLVVSPVVCILPNKDSFKPSPNPGEVDAIFDAPLDMFLKDENRRSEEMEWMGTRFLNHFFDYQCEQGMFLIWGLTASILIRAASIVFRRPPDFLEQIDPDFQKIFENEKINSFM